MHDCFSTYHGTIKRDNPIYEYEKKMGSYSLKKLVKPTTINRH